MREISELDPVKGEVFIRKIDLIQVEITDALIALKEQF
ncbi:unnamed protein product [Heligmosomoides polygyrus]|uniref:Uncharacterized protein n=1 Tax=Heligmosomoides polygyrus TaxID=6339 RepID=A0A3P8FHR0_HELPZ|nr:unnamed protein product [Heligmosomoides polygyrus]